MKASPQPTVVPSTVHRGDGDRPLRPRYAVHDQHPARPERDDQPLAVLLHDPTKPVHRGVRRISRPADDRQVDRAHRGGEPFQRVVPEAEEVGHDLDMIESSGATEPVELGDHALDEDGVQAASAGQQPFLVGREPQVGAHALDVVIHPWLSIRQELDVDRRRWPVPDGRGRVGVDAVALQHVEEQVGLGVTDPGDEPERQTEPSPVPGHIERAAAGEHRAIGLVAVEAERADEQRVRLRLGHRPASGSVRASPSSRKRSRRTSTTLLICQNASTDRCPQPSA